MDKIVNPENVNPHFEHPEQFGLHEPRPHPESLKPYTGR